MSADPVIPDPTNPQDYNRYSYVENNPVTLTDPSGFDPNDYCENNGEGEQCAPGAGMMEGFCYGNCGGWYQANYYNGQAITYNNGSSSDASDSGPTDDSSSDATADSSSDATGDSGTNAPGAGSFASGGASSGGDQPPPEAQGSAQVVTVTAPYVIYSPNNIYQWGTTGSFGCGGSWCLYQIGPLKYGGLLIGAWFNLNLLGQIPKGGQWVQTYFNSATGQYATDCGATCPSPYYTSNYSNAAWFFDIPHQGEAASLTWVAQVSYVLPNQGGIAFTLQWGYTASNGNVLTFGPTLVAPWPQQLTQGSQ